MTIRLSWLWLTLAFGLAGPAHAVSPPVPARASARAPAPASPVAPPLVAPSSVVTRPAAPGPAAAAPPPVAPAGPRARPGSVRSINNVQAYKRHTELGPHLSIKITPPGRRGKRGFVLIEAYNYANITLHAVDLRIVMDGKEGEELNAYVSCNNVRPGLSGLTWLKLQNDNKPVQIIKAQLKKMAIFDNQGKRITLAYNIDIIQ